MLYLDTRGSMYTWIHGVQGIPGNTGFKVYPIHRVQGIPGYTGFKVYLDTQVSRYTLIQTDQWYNWIHTVHGIPGYKGFKVYLDTQGSRYTRYTGFKVYLDTQGSRYTWIQRVQGIPGFWIHRVQGIPGYTGALGSGWEYGAVEPDPSSSQLHNPLRVLWTRTNFF